MNRIQSIIADRKAKQAKRKARRAELGLDRPIDQTRAVTKKALDDLWATFIKLRDRLRYGDVCRVRKARMCSGRGEVAYHLVPKQRGDAVRWDLENGVLACSACNGGESANRDLYADYHVELFGKELIDGLKARSRTLVKFSRVDLWSIAEGIRTEIGRVRIGGARKCP